MEGVNILTFTDDDKSLQEIQKRLQRLKFAQSIQHIEVSDTETPSELEEYPPTLQESTAGYSTGNLKDLVVNSETKGCQMGGRDEHNDSSPESVTLENNPVDNNLIRHILDFDSPLLTPSYEVEDIEGIRDKLTGIVTKLSALPEQSDNREAVANYRKLDVDLFHQDKCFYVLDKAYLKEHMGREYFNPNYGIVQDETSLFKERFIIPVHDFQHKVAGFVGYDNLSNVKYINSKNPGYSRGHILLGAHHFKEYLQGKYIIVVEGVFDYYSLRGIGEPVVSTLGVLLTRFQQEYLTPFERVIIIGDNDETGDKLITRLRKHTNYDFLLFNKTLEDLKRQREEKEPVLDTNWGDYLPEVITPSNKTLSESKDIDDYIKAGGLSYIKEGITTLLSKPKGSSIFLPSH